MYLSLCPRVHFRLAILRFVGISMLSVKMYWCDSIDRPLAETTEFKTASWTDCELCKTSPLHSPPQHQLSNTKLQHQAPKEMCPISSRCPSCLASCKPLDYVPHTRFRPHRPNQEHECIIFVGEIAGSAGVRAGASDFVPDQALEVSRPLLAHRRGNIVILQYCKKQYCR